jgi:hypothetical protein
MVLLGPRRHWVLSRSSETERRPIVAEAEENESTRVRGVIRWVYRRVVEKLERNVVEMRKGGPKSALGVGALMFA